MNPPTISIVKLDLQNANFLQFRLRYNWLYKNHCEKANFGITFLFFHLFRNLQMLQDFNKKLQD